MRKAEGWAEASRRISKCPTCGGTVKTQVARHALTGDDYFSMDEEA